MRSEFQIEIHRSNHEAQAHDRLIATRDRPFFKTRDADACDLFVCTSRISDAARFEYAIASAAKRLRSNGLRGSVDEIRDVCVGNLEVMARSGPPEIMDL